MKVQGLVGIPWGFLKHIMAISSKRFAAVPNYWGVVRPHCLFGAKNCPNAAPALTFFKRFLLLFSFFLFVGNKKFFFF